MRGRPCRFQREKHSRQREQPLLSVWGRVFLACWLNSGWSREGNRTLSGDKVKGRSRPFLAASEITVRGLASLWVREGALKAFRARRWSNMFFKAFLLVAVLRRGCGPEWTEWTAGGPWGEHCRRLTESSLAQGGNSGGRRQAQTPAVFWRSRW